MLKKLELVGFKSFADKTTFDFGPGVTAIVGPNGSGKSNVVDAVRWLLGEQSAKSLRGGEMTDVIFNGSASRRGFGMAEVNMTLDNQKRVLAYDVDEVQVTRRVYRTGEGEYLINHQPARLKDIKDLFLGSGAGADAYCIIEQGKVDSLLQASTRERRIIFEEAAGISRYRVRKTETLRKLERVDQNLQRLRDIVDEVEKQLRSVKLQAAKAQRYQEHTLRLKELRIGLGLLEYHQLDEKLGAETATLGKLRSGMEQQASQVQAWDAEIQFLDASVAQLDDQLRQQEQQLATAREHISVQEAAIGHENQLLGDLQVEIARLQSRVQEMQAQQATLAEAVAAAAAELVKVERAAEEQRQKVRFSEAELHECTTHLAESRQQVEADKAEHLDQMRQAARLQNDAVSYKAHLDNLSREWTRLRQRSAQVAEHLASLDLELQALAEADAQLQQRVTNARAALVDERRHGDDYRRLCDETQALLSELRQQRSGLTSRAEVLEGLERSHEGLGTGVRELLDLLEASRQRGDASCPWQCSIVGMIADYLTVRREYAPLIDLALGDWTQRFVVRDAKLLAEALAARPQPFAGRVSFLPLHDRNLSNVQLDERRRNRLIDLSLLSLVHKPTPLDSLPAQPGVIACAEQLVSCEHAELQELPAQLLGRTLLVRDLPTARSLTESTSGFRFITLQGELLEPDGTLTIGVHHAETGILSRKSELRELRAQLATLDQRITGIEQDVSDLQERIAVSAHRVQSMQEECAVLAEQAADLRARLERHRDRRQGLHEEATLSQDEMQRLEEEIAAVTASCQQARQQAAAAEARVQELQAQLEQTDQDIRQREHKRQQLQSEHTAGKIGLAKVEERLAALRQRQQQLQSDLQQRQQELTQSEQSLANNEARFQESQHKIVAVSAAVAEWYMRREQAESAVNEVLHQREQTRGQRTRLLDMTQQARSEWQAFQQNVHTHELCASDHRHKRDALTARLREDYQLDLAELYQQAVTDGLWNSTTATAETAQRWYLPTDVQTAHDEMEELRLKLTRLGSVNLDSLQELQALEARANALNTQFEDLTAAKRSLEDIINRINQDSKRLFAESFQVIRLHFQELFRKLFGGGLADIILEDENDILECGIEINARPPGKELRSISLMSGGEKTMTAVALLLAIFRSKPSPFCILDEVDAALDDANIGRFANVVREFLDLSQFIIVTHSKRTMSAADVIYGVTMQESGISKRVAIRFEDWPDDGTPAKAQLQLGAIAGK